MGVKVGGRPYKTKFMTFFSENKECNPRSKDWSDLDGLTCSNYKNYGLCTADGGYGTHWGNRGLFLEYFKNGFSAVNCPECGCIGTPN